ncbi:DUF3103 family protein [Streptomyces sp. NRRL F-5727]|uniref:DUF3103 family protein n=1 Tax=Streptomyces sp. NRRL F-5727 TaxID=1463871 RepID=UPI00068FDA08|nr:DUF3103 family protein [Streptomyces sp. NRRL F-5727]
MSVRKQLRTALCGLALTGVVVTAAPATAVATPAVNSAAKKSPVTAAEDAAARALARSLADSAWRAEAGRAVADGTERGLGALAGGSRTRAAAPLAAAVAAADRAVATAKGLPADTGALLTVTLTGATHSGRAPLVAVEPSDDEATAVTAYDTHGRAHTLDVSRTPDVPVYVVGVDGEKAVEAGTRVLERELAAAGVATAAPDATTPTTSATSASSTGFWTSRITSVRLDDDKETWIKGDAEIFSIVSGFGLDGKVRVDTVTHPYLDDAGTTYHPNQILVNWSLYKYNLADAVMMEDDGDTDYSALAKAIAAALLTIADLGAYIPLVDPVVDAVPSSFWTDDADFVDAWYTLAREMTGTRDGAGANGRFTFDRYWVSAL